jgi:thioredoxin-related protein
MVLGAVPSEARSPGESLPESAVDDVRADARGLVAAAVRRAARDHNRVLVMVGGEGSGWGERLPALLRTDPKVREKLAGEYHVVRVDPAAADAGVWIKAWGLDRPGGALFLVVLDDQGAVVVRQEAAAFEAGQQFDSAKVAAFLDEHRAEPVDAFELLDRALAEARREDKRVLLHFGAEWCGWCHRLDAFLERPEIADRLGRDYIELKLDLERMRRAREVLARFPHATDSGIPWWAVLGPDGRTLFTSFAEPEDPRSNVGYPLEPHEIAHFVKMLRETARRLDSEAIGEIEAALEAAAVEIKKARSG